jgi:hypothetical protein
MSSDTESLFECFKKPHTQNCKFSKFLEQKFWKTLSFWLNMSVRAAFYLILQIWKFGNFSNKSSQKLLKNNYYFGLIRGRELQLVSLYAYRSSSNGLILQKNIFEVS